MLSVRQLLVVSAKNPRGALDTNALLAELLARPLSLRSVITAYEKQRLLVFVTLASTRALLSPNIRSIADLIQAAKGPDGQLVKPEVVALSSRLQEQGLSLRLVDKDLRKAAIVGMVPSVANVPTVVVNDGNLTRVQDAASGVAHTAEGVATFGTVLITISAVPEPASPILFLIGLGLASFAAGGLLGVGIVEVTQGDQSVPMEDSPQSSTTPNEVDGKDSGTIEVPDAAAFGSPPIGLSFGDALQQLISGDLSSGWDSATGEPLPGIDDPGGDDPGGDDPPPPPPPPPPSPPPP